MISARRCTRCLAVLACLWTASPTMADVSLPKIISDHMILQADQPARIFGTADDGENVTVELLDDSGKLLQRKATVTKGGKWSVSLDPVRPGLELGLKISGKNQIEITDVLSGEVWHVSGQSNMRYPLSKLGLTEEDFAKLDYPNIRFMFAPSSRWNPVRPSRKRSGVLSALALYFAQTLHADLDRPIGIIDSSKNGAGAQQFISKKAVASDPKLAESLTVHGLPIGDVFNRNIAGIVPYTVRGVFWCQGEANRDFPETYRRLLPALMADWRGLWGQPDLPFIIVQNANYQERKQTPWEGGDCAIREAQLNVVQSDPHAALVVAIDLGIAENVHYPNKRPAAQRAAWCARALVYGEDIVYSGPLFKEARFQDGKAIVSFTHVGGGLVSRGEELKGFLLLDKKKRPVRAKAVIEGDTVVVSSPQVPQPVSVRYAWERNPDCNLYNAEGLPASPFRSDTFANYFTQDKKPKEKPAKPVQSKEAAEKTPRKVATDPARLKRIRAAKMPEVTQPIQYNTPEADAVLSALEVFPPDNAFNEVITDWPVHPHSRDILDSVGLDKPLRYNTDMAFVLVPSSQPKVPVELGKFKSESDRGPYPVPANMPIEGWPTMYKRKSEFQHLSFEDVQRDRMELGGDRHAIVVDPQKRMLYEFYSARLTDKGWQAKGAAIFDLKSNRLRPAGWTSADAAGLPIFPAVARYDELKRGIVEHAMRVTVRRTRRAYVHPATHYASRLTDKNLPRMGERLRLRADFDISGFSPEVQAILRGLKKYGMFVADNGIEWAISVTPDPRIPNLHEELRKIQGKDFEVVIAPE